MHKHTALACSPSDVYVYTVAYGALAWKALLLLSVTSDKYGRISTIWLSLTASSSLDTLRSAFNAMARMLHDPIIITLSLGHHAEQTICRKPTLNIWRFQ